MHNGTQGKQETRTFIKDFYALFFFRSFKAPRATWKFIKSWFKAFVNPGGLNPRMDCGPHNRYLSDVRLAETLFSLVILSSIGNFMQDFEGVADPISAYLLGYLENAYLLWLYTSLLVAAIFVQRLWLRLTKANFLPRRELATLFVYETGVLIVPLTAIVYVADYQLFEPVSPQLSKVLLTYGILAVIHLIVFFVRLGSRAALPVWKRVWTSLLLIYLAIFAWLPGLLIALPFYLLPLLMLVYPVWALVRDFVPKPASARRLFARVQEAIEA